MERAVALKKLSRLLGKGMGYRINAKASDAEQRETARTELATARAYHGKLNDACKARYEALLAGDAEYQSLVAARKDAHKEVERLNGIAYSYKIRVGASNGLFFTIEAEGDSWEDVITKIEAKKVRR